MGLGLAFARFQLLGNDLLVALLEHI